MYFILQMTSKINLGQHSYKGNNVVVKYWNHIENPGDIMIGKYCSIANDVTFYIDGNHRMDYASTYPFREVLGWNEAPKSGWGKGVPLVENDVWIADGAIIQSGVIIHNGAVVSGYTNVTKDVPPYAVVGGNPAKIIRYRFDPETIDKLLSIQWWDMEDQFIKSTLAPHMQDVNKVIKLCASNQV